MVAHARVALVALCCASVAANALAASGTYVKRDTWRSTLEAYFDPSASPGARPGRDVKKVKPKSVTSPELLGGQNPRKIKLDVRGQKDLVLFVHEWSDGNRGDEAVWANARLIDARGRTTYLDTLQPVSSKVGAGSLEVVPKGVKRPAAVGKYGLTRYIVAHAPSHIHYRIDGRYVRFEALIGIRKGKTGYAGSCSFEATTDASGVATSGSARDQQGGGGIDDPFWQKFIGDFPRDSANILIVRDWCRRDKIEIDQPDEDFAPKAKATLAHARKTVAYVGTLWSVAELSAELEALDAKMARGGSWRMLWLAAHDLRRKTILSHPALDFEKILVNVNPPTTYSHNGDQHLGRHSRVGPGLTMLTDWKTDHVRARAILAGRLPRGATRNPCLDYDAGKVLFAFCDHTRPGQKRYFIYEAGIDGSKVRQVTGTARDNFMTRYGRATVIIEDNDPCYLPDGDTMFISTRGQTFGRCHGGRYNPAWVLYRCKPDGSGARQLSFGNENEYNPAVLNDGRIVFSRWEYTNRHEMWFHMLWWCRPDGTMPSHFWGNDTIHPMQALETLPIPGTHKVVCTMQGHHSYTTGTAVVIDTNLGENGEEPLTHITPETPYSETRGWPEPHYSHPYPVTDELFLVSRANHPIHHQGKTPPVADRGIYLVDPTGGREMIYEHPQVASVSPIPIRKRERPPVLSTMTRPDAEPFGTVFVQNVYLTRNDPSGVIKPGMIKALRINALGPQPRASRDQCHMSVTVEIPKKVVGTVPVSESGSAHFKVPANVSLQIQTLDENGMAILTEKSLFYLQPGEHRSCVGCHEQVGETPNLSLTASAYMSEPVEPMSAAGPQYPGGFSFMRTVQPVLDRYCIGCHGLGRAPEAKRDRANKVNLIHDGKMRWPRPYVELYNRGKHKLGDKGFMGGAGGRYDISRPRRFYAHSNKVAHMLAKNHSNCDMDRDSYMRVIEWMDVNAQCYGDLFPNKLEERTIDPRGMAQVRQFAKRLFGDAFENQPDRALINTVQVDESRILMAPLPASAGGWGQMEGYKGRKGPRYRKMAALVEAAIVRKPNENRNGWQPTMEMGGGEKWVIEDRARYIKSVRSR